MKKLFALLLSACLILGLAAGCGNTASAPETSVETTEGAPTPIGTLLVSMGDTFELVYDKDGKIVELKGTNDNSTAIAADLQHHLGRDCVHGVRALMSYYNEKHILGDTKTMAIRVGFGDPLPTDDFVDTCVNDTQLLADEEFTGVRIFKIGESDIDDKGLLTPEMAKKLAGRYLEATAEELTGEDVVTENLYAYSLGDKACTVDAATGLVAAK